MQSRDETSFQREQFERPGFVSHTSRREQVVPGSGSEVPIPASESGAYTAEEEALVEERLKHLGYL